MASLTQRGPSPQDTLALSKNLGSPLQLQCPLQGVCSRNHPLVRTCDTSSTTRELSEGALAGC